MRHYIKILTLSSVILSSCLKDTGYTETMNDKGSIIVEIKEATALPDGRSTLLLMNATPAVEEVSAFEVRIGSKNNTNKDYKIKLTPNNTLVAALSASYIVPNSSQVEIPSLEVVIPSGSSTGKFKIKVNKNNLNLSNVYALGFSIADGDGATISANAKQIVAVITVKNQWDGMYKSKGNFQHPNPANVSSWTFAEGVTRAMETTGVTTIGVGVLKTRTITFGVGYFLTINPDNSVGVTFTGVTDDPDGSPNPNRYDPGTKTFYINASYNGGTRVLTDTLVYTGPR